jgi:RNA polymerase sigma factor (sigma-70 family)
MDMMEKLTDKQRDLITDHYTYALKLLGKMSRRSSTLQEERFRREDDFESAAMWGLVQAAKNYDESRGEFRWFAGKWIIKGIFEELYHGGGPVRLPHSSWRGENEKFARGVRNAIPIEKYVEDGKEPPEPFREEDALKVINALESAPIRPSTREAIRLRFYEELTWDEVGDAIDEDGENTRRRCERALRKTREYLTPG